MSHVSHDDGIGEAYRLLSATADAAPGGLYRMEADTHRLAYVSRGYAEVTGYDLGVMEARFAGDALRIVHPADREAVAADWRQQVALHADHSYDLEYRIVCEGGAVLHVNDRGARVRDERTGKTYLCGLLMNISDTYAAQQRLLAAQQELVEANRAKNDFLAHMSHEIRTPIHAVTGLADLLLLSDTLLPEPYSHALGIKSAAQTLLYLVNDILDFSKISAGRMPIIPAPFRIQTLLEDLCTQISLRARGKHVTLLVDVTPKLPQALIGDELRLKQVLLNLLTNAVKFTDAGTVTLRIAVESQEAGNRVRVRYAVQDTGIGIRKEDLEKLFDQFRQLDPVKDRKQEGTGLGLAISRQLVHLMGADIEVESCYGQGSCFSFALTHDVEDAAPIAVVDHAERKRLLVCSGDDAWARHMLETADGLGVEASRVYGFSTMQRYTHVLIEGNGLDALAWAGAALLPGMSRAIVCLEGASPAQAGDLILEAPVHAPMLAAFLNNTMAGAEGTLRNEQLAQHLFGTQHACVLIVDDNPANLLVGSSLLKLFGLTVREANSGRQALEMVGQQAFDLVFMDHMMPELSGEETVRAMRMRPELAALPIVVLTANLPAETHEIYQGIDIQGVLTKPLELSKLSATLLRLLPPEKIAPDGAGVHGEHAGGGDVQAVLARVPMLDYAQGMVHCAQDEGLYVSVLFALVQDLADKLALLDGCLVGEKLAEEETMRSIALCVHSVKSGLRSIGCAPLGELAQELELQAKAGETETLRNGLPPFLRQIEEFRLALQVELRRLPREMQVEFALPIFEGV